MTMSQLERKFAFQCKAYKLPTLEREFRFHPVRRWRFDFALVDLKIAVELEGGTYSRGRHTRGSGFKNDCIKYNAAVLLGWRVLRFDSKMVNSGQAIDTLRIAIVTFDNS